MRSVLSSHFDKYYNCMLFCFVSKLYVNRCNSESKTSIVLFCPKLVDRKREVCFISSLQKYEFNSLLAFAGDRTNRINESIISKSLFVFLLARTRSRYLTNGSRDKILCHGCATRADWSGLCAPSTAKSPTVASSTSIITVLIFIMSSDTETGELFLFLFCEK